MRLLITVQIPVDGGNRSIKDGSLPATMQGFIERFKPESAYFTLLDGKRTAYFVVDAKESSVMPQIAEAFFQNLNANITMTPAMNQAELKQGLEATMGQLAQR